MFSSYDSFPLQRSLIMQTPSDKLLHLDPGTPCQKTLCVSQARGLLPLSQDLQPSNGRFSRKLQNNETTILKQSSLKKGLRPPPGGKLKPISPETRKVSFCDEPFYETVIPSYDHSRAQLLFPDFFPRGKLSCHHQDCLIPLNVKADPVLVSWLHLFGLQMTK